MHDVKGRKMDSQYSTDDLQKAADYFLLHKNLNVAGKWCIFWGILLLVAVATDFQSNVVHYILLALGAVLVAHGLWVIISPSVTGIIIEGILILFIGLWNVMFSLGFLTAGEGGVVDYFFLILGVMQIGFAFHPMGIGKRLLGKNLQKPPVDVMKWFDTTVRVAMSQDPASVWNLIEFTTKKRDAKVKWRAMLFDDMALFVEKIKSDIIVADREKVKFKLKGEINQNNLNVFLFVGKRSLLLKITKKYYSRLDAWKSDTKETQPETAAPD